MPLPAALLGALLLLLLLDGAHAVENGLALTPPQGWRSWNQIGVFKGRAPTENADTQAINMVYILCAVQ